MNSIFEYAVENLTTPYDEDTFILTFSTVSNWLIFVFSQGVFAVLVLIPILFRCNDRIN